MKTFEGGAWQMELERNFICVQSMYPDQADYRIPGRLSMGGKIKVKIPYAFAGETEIAVVLFGEVTFAGKMIITEWRSSKKRKYSRSIQVQSTDVFHPVPLKGSIFKGKKCLVFVEGS